jgi:hypothetical protein
MSRDQPISLARANATAEASADESMPTSTGLRRCHPVPGSG